MKINENGIVREMTPDEIKRNKEEFAEFSNAPVSSEQRIANLESELQATKVLLGLEE